MSEREDYSDTDVIDGEDRAALDGDLGRRTPAFPQPPAPAAFYGLAGEFVRALEPHTEADPAALLVQLLVVIGSIMGRDPHFLAEGAEHHGNLFAVIVGTTSKGRKGSSFSQIKRLAREIDSTWKPRSGVVSGEGIIYHVRDASGEDAGATDKRLCLVEAEFASVLKVATRDGSTLSGWLRTAWDDGSLETLAKNRPCVATDAHVSVIGHITKLEICRCLTATESANGFGNRFLWACSRRSKLLPRGGSFVLDPDVVEAWRDVRRHANGHGLLRLSDEAGRLWDAEYQQLSEARPGLFGNVTSRAEAQTMRLALIYALLDRARAIEVPHLRAALALWDYCERSARFIFGDALGEPLADDLCHRLREAGASGLTKSDLFAATGRNRSAFTLSRALELLLEHGLATRAYEHVGVRPVERWWAVTNYESTKETNRDYPDSL